jgi:hypothetical protein
MGSLEHDHALQFPSWLICTTSAAPHVAFVTSGLPSEFCVTTWLVIPTRYYCILFLSSSPWNAYATTVLHFSHGGVGGFPLASALSKSPYTRLYVYEAASKFTEIGSGIGAWRRTRQVIKSLDIEEVFYASYLFAQAKTEVN